ncbi:MAG: hypothetical protein OXP71_00985 [Candidatus Poribacteria bacterium]|nr:hypothetical protein [Candidatus Poribacteria bacterium]
MPRLVCTILWVSLFIVRIASLYAEEPQIDQDEHVDAKEEQLEADLPDVIRAKIIDKTRIVLEPRRRFSDPSKPKLISAKGIYAKERLWNLSPASIPQKAVAPQVAHSKTHVVNFTAYPSFPDSLYYRALFGVHANRSRGFLYLDGKQLGDKRTRQLGDYNYNSVRGELSYQHLNKSEISLDVGLDLKSLNWRSAPNNQEREKLPKDFTFLSSAISWKQQIGESAWTRLNLDAESMRLTHDAPDQQNDGTDLRFNCDAMIPLPFQNPFQAGDTVDVNPIHIGSAIEYYAINTRGEHENWSPIIRLYVRDEFTLFGPFALSMRAEGVNFSDRTDSGEDLTRLRFDPSLAVTTNLGRRWIFRIHGMRTTHQPKLSSLYFETDYISFNPSLRPEKTWDGRVKLKYHQGRKLVIGLSGFARQIDDLVVLERVTDKQSPLAWVPANIEAQIYGGKLDFSAQATNRLEFRLQYIHEFHRPKQVENINYRPEDLVNLRVEYYISGDFRFELDGEFSGARYAEKDETLDHYFLFKPRLSKTVGTYIDTFIGCTFAIGEYAVLHKDLTFSQNTVDFGVELRF